MKIEMTVNVWRDRDTGQFVAHGMPIDVASHGPTPAAAEAALDEAVLAFASAATQHGTLDESMEECGYERRGDDWVAPVLVASERRLVTAAG